MAFAFKRTIVGGTFDHLHTGHQKLLTTAFEQSAFVVIGIATNNLFQHKTHSDLIEDFVTRKTSVENFLSSQQLAGRFEIVPINDFYGTSLVDKTIEAIVITDSNKENVDKINAERTKRGFEPLQAVIVPYVTGEDGEVISSAQIRNGQIDRKGHKYLSQFLTEEAFHLPEKEREKLRVPIGAVYQDVDAFIDRYGKKQFVVAVGDVIANALLHKDVQAGISIVDGKTRRNEIIDNTTLEQTGKLRQTVNAAGTINKQAVTCLQAAIGSFQETNQKQVITVSGEEDLLAIPAILFSPLQSVVVYGLFGHGIVAAEVTEQNKQNVQELFRKFQ